MHGLFYSRNLLPACFFQNSLACLFLKIEGSSCYSLRDQVGEENLRCKKKFKAKEKDCELQGKSRGGGKEGEEEG